MIIELKDRKHQHKVECKYCNHVLRFQGAGMECSGGWCAPAPGGAGYSRLYPPVLKLYREFWPPQEPACTLLQLTA